MLIICFDSVEKIATMPDAGFVGAAMWISDAMTGTVAACIATLAIATFGFAALQGHLSLKNGARIVLGCFILFGAPSIAKALMPEQRPSIYGEPAGRTRVQETPNVPTPPAPNHDPYAGASVPKM